MRVLNSRPILICKYVNISFDINSYSLWLIKIPVIQYPFYFPCCVTYTDFETQCVRLTLTGKALKYEQQGQQQQQHQFVQEEGKKSFLRMLFLTWLNQARKGPFVEQNHYLGGNVI